MRHAFAHSHASSDPTRSAGTTAATWNARLARTLRGVSDGRKKTNELVNRSAIVATTASTHGCESRMSRNAATGSITTFTMREAAFEVATAAPGSVVRRREDMRGEVGGRGMQQHCD